MLTAKGIDPKLVLVLRHAPPAILTNLLPMWALEEPALYNAYQQSQGDRAEASMKKAQYVASFIGMDALEALFVGLYKVVGHKPVAQDRLWSLPAYKAMEAVGLRKISAVAKREKVLFFDLELTDWYSNWKGKLVIDWPPSRTWARWADRNGFAVKSISPESALARPMKAWNEIVLSYADLQNLPKSWRAELARWRGVYLIVDTSVARHAG